MGESGDWKSTPPGAGTGIAPALNGPMLKGIFGIDTRNASPFKLRGTEGEDADITEVEVGEGSCPAAPVVDAPMLMLLLLRFRIDSTGKDVISLLTGRGGMCGERLCASLP